MSFDVEWKEEWRYSLLFQERFNRVMASHSEFKELQEAEQHMHLKNTLFPALAITFARGETCNSGEDQLQFYGQVRIIY